MVQTAGEDEQEAAAEAAESFLAEELPEATFGAAKAGSGMWASCLRVMHPTEVGGSWVTIVTHQLTSLVVYCRVALWTWYSLSKMKQPSGKALALCLLPPHHPHLLHLPTLLTTLPHPTQCHSLHLCLSQRCGVVCCGRHSKRPNSQPSHMLRRVSDFV